MQVHSVLIIYFYNVCNSQTTMSLLCSHTCTCTCTYCVITVTFEGTSQNVKCLRHLHIVDNKFSEIDVLIHIITRCVMFSNEDCNRVF